MVLQSATTLVILFDSHNKGLCEKTAVMVNFMCQLDWATGCPDIWSNIVLGISFRVFFSEINIYIGRLSKADCSP